MNKSHGEMKKVFYNIYLSLTGKIEKTDLDMLPGYIDSRVRHIYRMVDGEIIETCINPLTNEVLYNGVY